MLVVSNLASPLPNSVATTNTADELETLQFEFANLEEDHFDSLSPADMRVLLKRSAYILVSSSSPTLNKIEDEPIYPLRCHNTIHHTYYTSIIYDTEDGSGLCFFRGGSG